jgi:hypothetical protein
VSIHYWSINNGSINDRPIHDEVSLRVDCTWILILILWLLLLLLLQLVMLLANKLLAILNGHLSHISDDGLAVFLLDVTGLLIRIKWDRLLLLLLVEYRLLLLINKLLMLLLLSHILLNAIVIFVLDKLSFKRLFNCGHILSIKVNILRRGLIRYRPKYIYKNISISKLLTSG